MLWKSGIAGLLALAELSAAVPSPYWSKQHLLDQAPLKPNGPYHPGHRDRYDYKVDAEGRHLDPLPWRNDEGDTVLGPWNRARSRQNPDLVRPPSTDSGVMKNMRWSFADSHIRIEEGGWTRQTTIRELPSSVELAGVNMRLGPGVIREVSREQSLLISLTVR